MKTIIQILSVQIFIKFEYILSFTFTFVIKSAILECYIIIPLLCLAISTKVAELKK